MRRPVVKSLVLGSVATILVLAGVALGQAPMPEVNISPQFTFSGPTAPGLHVAHFTLERV